MGEGDERAAGEDPGELVGSAAVVYEGELGGVVINGGANRMRTLVAKVGDGERYYFPDRPTTSVSGPAWIYDDGEIIQVRYSGKGESYASTHRDTHRTTFHDTWTDGYPKEPDQ